MRYPSRSATVVLAALLLGACSSSGSTDPGLADSVRAQAEAQDALRERVSEVEDQVAAVLSRDDITDFRNMQEALDELRTRLDEMSQQIGDAEIAAEDRAATVDATLTQLTEDVESLTAAVAGLQADLQQLREDHESLQVQFQTHRTDDRRHN